MSERPEPYAKPMTIYVEKWARFVLVDGHWDLQLWANNAVGLVTDKLYRIRVPVPVELIGEEIVAEIGQNKAWQVPYEETE